MPGSSGCAATSSVRESSCSQSRPECASRGSPAGCTAGSAARIRAPASRPSSGRKLRGSATVSMGVLCSFCLQSHSAGPHIARGSSGRAARAHVGRPWVGTRTHLGVETFVELKDARRHEPSSSAPVSTGVRQTLAPRRSRLVDGWGGLEKHDGQGPRKFIQQTSGMPEIFSESRRREARKAVAPARRGATALVRCQRINSGGYRALQRPSLRRCSRSSLPSPLSQRPRCSSHRLSCWLQFG